MKLEEQNVTLRKLVASEGKVLVPKDKTEEEAQEPSKVIYLGINDSPDNYEEIDEINQNTEGE